MATYEEERKARRERYDRERWDTGWGRDKFASSRSGLAEVEGLREQHIRKWRQQGWTLEDMVRERGGGKHFSGDTFFLFSQPQPQGKPLFFLQRRDFMPFGALNFGDPFSLSSGTVYKQEAAARKRIAKKKKWRGGWG